ncbi:MAG: hypothetical protein HN714_01675 [Formosa sp.]|jgi:hypothetical protein|nr:hypothetical protein [Formosa sp.]MDG1374828.1 hypothetical protein [Flavobacteriaceae bacterium]
MSTLRFILVLLVLSISSCSNETYEEDGNQDINGSDPLDYFPNTVSDYWIYDVESTSSDTPTMNFTGSDSLYIAASTATSFSYEANNGGVALGSMNTLLVNGSLSKTTTSLKFTGSLDLPVDISLTQSPEITELTIIDLDASNGEVLSNLSDNLSETIDIQGTAIPIEINYSLTTEKENFYNSTSLNGTTYSNVYEATLKLNISVTGSLTLFGTSQSINIIQPQDVLTMRYFYVGGIGLVRAETTQMFQLSDEFILLIQQLDSTGSITASSTAMGVEELNRFMIN